MKEMADIYLILGTADSGRRAILIDLIEGSIRCKRGKTIVLINKKEKPSIADEELKNLPDTKVIDWDFERGSLNIPKFEIGEQDSVFLMLSSQEDLINQIEQIKYWLDKHSEFRLTRILSIIDCQLASRREDLLPWFKAVIYFSDYVLLNRRENVPEKWVLDFIKSFEKENYPCLFEKIRKNKVTNPDLILEAEARRISHIFDDLEAIDTMEFDEDNLPEGPFDLIRKEDPYLEKDDRGRRVIQLPSIFD